MENNTVSKTDFLISSLSLKLGVAYQYIGFGLTSIIFNVFILIVLVFNKNLLKKFAFIFGLTLSDAILGLAFFISGLSKSNHIKHKSNNDVVHPSVCMETYTQFYILGNQLSAAMYLLISIERFMSVSFFPWYCKKWSHKVSWMGNLCALLVTVISLSIAYIVAFSKPDDHRIDNDCFISAVVGDTYLLYNSIVIAACGAVAFLTTFVSNFVFSQRRKLADSCFSEYTVRMRITIRRNIKVTRILLILTFLDFFLGSITNIVQIIVVLNSITLTNLQNYLLELFCIRGSLNLFIIFTNDEFRHTIHKMFIPLCGKPTTNIHQEAVNQENENRF